jgi:hypothetical protein
MFVIYIYDLNAKDKKKFNRLKRTFYYHLNKLPLTKESWKTKSTIAIELKKEKLLDTFFRRFKQGITIHKFYTNSIEEFE